MQLRNRRRDDAESFVSLVLKRISRKYAVLCKQRQLEFRENGEIFPSQLSFWLSCRDVPARLTTRDASQVCAKKKTMLSPESGKETVRGRDRDGAANWPAYPLRSPDVPPRVVVTRLPKLETLKTC